MEVFPVLVECSYCGLRLQAQDKKTEEKMVKVVGAHVRECRENPLVKRIQELEARVKELEGGCCGYGD